VFSLFMRDITDQVEAQTRMRLHDRALEASSEAVIIRDIQRVGHPVVYVNSAFERLTGRSASDVMNRPFSLMSGDLNPDTVLEEMRWALAHEKPFNTTVHVRRADGRSVWIALSSSPVRDNSGSVTHYVDVFGDVTERIEFERKLIRRTNRLHTVFALSPDGFVTFDENGAVTNVNPAFSNMTHLSQGELLGLGAEAFDRRIAALADPAKPWPELVLDRSTDEPQRLWLQHPEPRVIERSARVAPEGKSETVLYFRDITQQFEVDRMKGEFLSTAAHELRTPLASIFGFAELLINRDYDESSRRRMHGVIHRQSRVLVNLINDLLDLSRIEARAGQDFNFEDESVKSIINATVEGLAMPEGLQRLCLDVPRCHSAHPCRSQEDGACTEQCDHQRLQVFTGRQRGAGDRLRGLAQLAPDGRHAGHRSRAGHDACAAGAHIRALLSRRPVRQHSGYRARHVAGQGDHGSARRRDRDRKRARRGHHRHAVVAGNGYGNVLIR
jgi:PAS domain S-box-containing protein